METNDTETQKQAGSPSKALVITKEDADMVGLPSAEALSLLKKFATEVTGTPFFPRGLGDNPATILAVVLAGREMQMAPMEAIGSFYLSPGGRLGMYAEAMGARMLKAGFKIKILKREKWDGAIEVTPPNNGDTTSWTFSEDDARAAKLLPAKEDSNWNKYPRNMPIWRCEADAYRFYRGLLGGNGGVSVSAEELQDMEPAPEAPGETTESPKLEVIAGRRPKAGKEATEPAAAQTYTAQPEPQQPTTEDPLKGTVKEDPPPITKTGEHFVLRVGDSKTVAPEKQANFTTASLRLTALAKEHPGIPCALDQMEFFSNGTSRLTTRAEMTADKEGATAVESKPGPVAVPDKPAVVEPADPAREAAKQRYMSACAVIPVDAKIQKEVGDTFLCGFFGVPIPRQWPRDTDKKAAAVEALEKAIQMYPDKFKGSKSEVRAFGEATAKSTVADDSAPLYKRLGWSEETIGIARKARTILQHSAEDFSDWIDFMKLPSLDEKDQAAFLAVAAGSGRGTTNIKTLMDLSTKLGKSYSVIAGSIALEYGKPVAELNAAQIGEALTFIAGIADRGQPAVQNATTPVEATPPPAASEDDGWQ